MTRDELRELLIRHEGMRTRVYRCPAGKQTIGVGRNLEDVGLTEKEALFLLENDLDRIEAEARKNFVWFERLSAERKAVIISMIFNLGLSGFKGFKKMIAALEEGNFSEAATHMLESLWAKQVGKRAEELASMMRGV